MEKFRKQIDADLNLVTVLLSGEITEEDVLEDFRSELPGVESLASVNTLIDATAARLDLPFRSIERITAFLKVHGAVFAGGRWAIVAPAGVNFGIARMFQAISESAGITVEIFPDAVQARAWLGL